MGSCVELQSDDDDIQAVWEQPATSSNSTTSTKPSGISIPKRLELDEIKVDDKVYAPEKGCFDTWRAAKVVAIDDHCGKRFMRVEFLMGHEAEGESRCKTRMRANMTKKERSLTLKYLAYFDKPQNNLVLPVGVRVIAQANIIVVKGSRFYAGIVADTPKELNNNRYLIFFDSGDAKYVDPAKIRMICKYEANVWLDMHPNQQMFIKQYIEQYPANPVIKLKPDAITSVEFNGRWFPVRVIEVDCLLVKLQFITNNVSFWVYRGSERLLRNYINSLGEEPLCDYFQEYEGKVLTHKVPTQCKNLAKMLEKSHNCDKSCAPSFPGRPDELRNVSPLAIPYYYGWNRTIKHDSFPRITLYQTPCGKTLTSYEEIYEFLSNTASELEIDSFCFDPEVDCLAKFELQREPLIYEKDISNGQEVPNVERVNAVDYIPAPKFTYTANIIRTEGVNVNNDEGFLVCCDCKDDCQDKKNCPCCILTFESQPNLFSSDLDAEGRNSIINMIGYQNRRSSTLEKHDAGIYECNSQCKCKSSCSNRVVQNGLKWPLQIFKTARKGYAIRAMHDIPAGSFLCAYAGRLMTYDDANKAGRKYGDMYLANLDYIESLLDRKAGYEANVVEPSDALDASNKDNSNENSMNVRHDMEFVPFSPELLNVARKSTFKRKHDDGLEDTECPTAAEEFRRMFGKNEDIYTIDAMFEGSLSRYMNHSCTPNTFTQHVFVDTHDVRFPLVAFFTKTFIKCGNELTWDYNYEAGSVDGAVISCHCGVVNCRGRLL